MSSERQKFVGRALAVCYTPDDNCENAIVLGFSPPNWQNDSSFILNDWTFSPSRNVEQSRKFIALPYYPNTATVSLAAAFCPADSRRYVFMPGPFPAQNVLWTRFPSPYNDQSPPEVVLSAPDYNGFLAELPGQLVDMAVHFNGAQLEVAVLVAGGTLQLFRGTPWLATGPYDGPNLAWSMSGFAWQFPLAKRIAVSQGAGAGHVFLADDHNVTEVWYGPQNAGHDLLATFPDSILDIGSVFTPDGLMHVVVATIDPAAPLGSILYEVDYRPAQSPAVTRRIGETDFLLDGLGAYLKPDNAQHIIMSRRDIPYVASALYLSWGSPNLSTFEYGPFPNFSI